MKQLQIPIKQSYVWRQGRAVNTMKFLMEKETWFQVWYYCESCGYEWEQEFQEVQGDHCPECDMWNDYDDYEEIL